MPHGFEEHLVRGAELSRAAAILVDALAPHGSASSAARWTWAAAPACAACCSAAFRKPFTAWTSRATCSSGPLRAVSTTRWRRPTWRSTWQIPQQTLRPGAGGRRVHLCGRAGAGVRGRGARDAAGRCLLFLRGSLRGRAGSRAAAKLALRAFDRHTSRSLPADTVSKSRPQPGIRSARIKEYLFQEYSPGSSGSRACLR